MRCRFVSPDTTKIPLSDGDWIVVRRRLTAGEQRAAFARRYVASLGGGLRLDPLQTGVAQVVAYLLDWSLLGLDGNPVVIRGESPEVVEAALNALDPDDFIEIKEAIEKHEAASVLAREQEKKLPAGASGSSVISASQSDAGGASSGSAPSTPTTT
jgi:hypothetical protein